MKKRKKVIEAGTLRIAAAYTPPAPCDPEHIRGKVPRNYRSTQSAEPQSCIQAA